GRSAGVGGCLSYGLSAGMARWRLCSGVHSLPARLLALVLLVEPLLERSKVVKDGCGVHLALTADGFQGVRPWLALAHAQHFVQALTRGLVPVDGATMQRPLLPRRLAQRAVKLELQDAGQKVASVRRVRCNVILGARIKVGLAALDWRRHALVLGLQIPPRLVVLFGRDFSGKHLPAPLVDQEAKGQKSDLVHRLAQQVADV